MFPVPWFHGIVLIFLILNEGRCSFLKALTFKGGVHPLHKLHEGKPLAQNAALKEYAAATVVLPMSQHIGAPCTPCVEVGDEVLMGQVVGTPGRLCVRAHPRKRFRARSWR